MRPIRLGRKPAVAVICISVTGCFGGTAAQPDGGAAISVFGPYRGAEADHFAEVVEEFTERTGIPVRYTGSADLVADLERRTGDLNDPPDVAMVPQPGLVRQLVDAERIVELGDGAREALAANYTATARELGVVDGMQVGVPFRVNVKSLVWYRPDVFAERGWAIPRSLDELEAVSSRIESEGLMAPWCLAIAAGTATGWPATDWTEDLVLRLQGEAFYGRWSTGDIAFANPGVVDAFDRFRELVLVPGRLHNGTSAAVATSTQRIFEPLFGDDPGCAMAKQADFAIGWMPDGTVVGPDGDVDFFVLPGVAPSEEIPPLVVGGDVAVQFRDDSDVDAFVAFLGSERAGEPWARRGGFLSPKRSFDANAYPTEAQQRIAELVNNAPTLAFDASDQMPADIGSGLLWRDITAWITGALPYEELAQEIDAAFDATRQAASPPRSDS